jgi:hypothetical protein
MKKGLNKNNYNDKKREINQNNFLAIEGSKSDLKGLLGKKKKTKNFEAQCVIIENLGH